MPANGAQRSDRLTQSSGAPGHPSIGRAPLVDEGRVEVENASITFGSAVAGEPSDLPSAVTLRVFSSRPWALKLTPGAPLTNADRGETVDWGRIQWRKNGGKFVSLNAIGSVIARGAATGPAGELVTIDLRLAFGSIDPLGRYASNLRVGLESF